MTTTNINRLCKLIILQQFGSIVERVASTLLNRGRLNLNHLTIYTSNCNRKQVKDSLFILLQHNLVSHADHPEGKNFVTYYTLEVSNILDRLQIMNVLKLAKNRFGRAGQLIAQTMILNGKVKLKDVELYLEDEIEVVKKEEDNKDTVLENETKPTTTITQPKITKENLHTTMLKMLDCRLIKGITSLDMNTKKDLAMVEDDKVISRLGILPSDLQKKKALENRDQARKLDTKVELIIGKKRKYTGENDKDTKVKLEGGNVVEAIDENAYFCINYQQVKIAIRNQKLIKLASSEINMGAVEVLRAFVKTVESKTSDFKQAESASATGMEVIDQLNPNIRIESFVDFPNNNNNPTRPFSCSDLIRLLNLNEVGFLTKTDDRSLASYHIDYKKVTPRLRMELLESIIKFKFGNKHWRIICVLIVHGVMDERQIGKTAIIPQNEVRTKLEELSIHKIIQIQEIPRTIDRAPSRTFFLYKFNPEFCFKNLLDFVYRDMASLFERRKFEISSRKVLLDKLDRDDVKVDRGLLSLADRMELEMLDRVLGNLDVGGVGQLADMLVLLE